MKLDALNSSRSIAGTTVVFVQAAVAARSW
jgi:hypothetical protein